MMVQLPEPCGEKTEAYKAGYKNICEIGKERIRRAGDKIKADSPMTTQNLDIGFRVFRVDESNMEDVYYHPEEYTQQMLGDVVSNIKPDRTGLDLLYACLLDWGVEINLPHTSAVIDDCTVHNVDNGALMACFDKNVPESVIRAMAKEMPLRAVFRDNSFASAPEKINVTEIFKNLSPDTKVKVL
jgi:adenine-specific DNA-methyltransferase